jgi:hypothetical protein
MISRTLEGGQWKSVQVKLIVPAEYMPTLAVLIAGDGAAIPRNLLALFSRPLRSRIELGWTSKRSPKQPQEQGQEFPEPCKDAAEVVADG